MSPVRYPNTLVLIALLLAAPAVALERKDVTFRIFQFPATGIPRVDGKVDDWSMVPEVNTARTW